MASGNGHLSVVECLVNHEADINAQSEGKVSGTPLHHAVQNGHLGVVEYLINQKANIDSKTKDVESLILIQLLFT